MPYIHSNLFDTLQPHKNAKRFYPGNTVQNYFASPTPLRIFQKVYTTRLFFVTTQEFQNCMS